MEILETTDVGPCKKRLSVKVPSDEVIKELEDLYAEFSRNADVPGFRRGHAPRYVLRMRYGRVLEKEAVRQAADEAFRKAAEEAGLRPVTDPEFKDIDEIRFKENEPITFAVEVECIPDFELADYSELVPDLEKAEITEKEVVQTLESLRKESAYYRSVDRPVQDGDFVTCSVDATIEGQPFEEATHQEIIIEVGSKRYLPGFEEGLIGAEAGATQEMDLTLPDDYPVEERRGKQAHFSVAIKEIKVQDLPELDDDFAKDLGDFETLADLKDHIRTGLEKTVENRREKAKRDSIRQQLLEANQFDAPPSMIDAQLNYLQAVQDMELRRVGLSIEDAYARNPEMLAQNRKRAKDETRLTLILDEIAKRENLEVSDEEYQMYIAGLAQRENRDPAWYMRRIEEDNLSAYYRRLALEDKVIDFLLLPPEDRRIESVGEEDETGETTVETATTEEEVITGGSGTDGGGADQSG